MRKFTKFPNNYVRASMEDDSDGLTLDDMIAYIDAEWENLGCGEKMSRNEAEYYLGHSDRGMSKSEIDEEVSEIQKAYYTYGDPMGATDQEIIDMYNSMVNAKR